MQIFNFSEPSRQALKIAQSIAKEHFSKEYFGSHLFKALLHNEVGLSSVLVSYGKDVNYLSDWIDYRIEAIPKAGQPVSEPPAAKEVEKIFEVADLIKLKFSEDLITPFALATAILRSGIVFSDEQLKTINLSEKELIELRLENLSLGLDAQTQNEEKNKSSNGVTSSSSGALLKYCTDKTQIAHDGGLDEVIGREGELRKLKEIIGRRTKPNVIIVGEPGVGKTSLIDGFAIDLINDSVPEYMSGSILFELDLGALIAGAAYKGEIEDRLKKIIAELKKQESAILFIDEIHALLDPKSGFGGAANLLKPELARGEITVIGATTNEEYRKYIESDDAFSRRFDVVRVEEPDFDTAYQMLKKVVPYYEEHHKIEVENQAVIDSINLCQRYLKERKLPDAAIDLIDQTMSAIRMMKDTSSGLIQQYKEKVDTITDQDNIEDVLWTGRNINVSFSPILLGKQKYELQFSKNDTIEEAKNKVSSSLNEIEEIYNASGEKLTAQDIGSIVSQKTGIPMGKLQGDEKKKLLELEEILKRRVVGQEHAIHIISEAVRESRAGLIKEGQPIGSFFFMGPTGTGKTELAKTLADFLFNDEKALIRFDMSEFKEEHSVALLYGAPPGYVGYEEGGLLVNKIRQQPYSIVLFDEIEKAHQSVFDLFLQILDEGKLADRLGKIGDFSNAIILFTSNIGSDFIIEQFNKDIIPDTNVLMDRMSSYFRPEFLARLTEIVPFSPIQEKVILMIFDIQMKQLHKILGAKEIELEISIEAKKKIAMEDFDQKYGARPIKGRIRKLIRRPLSKKIISEEVKSGDKVKIDLENNELTWKVNK